MAGFCLPGPLGGYDCFCSLSDGTSALIRTMPPGPVVSNWLDVKSLVRRHVESTPDLRFLFRQCLNPVRGLLQSDYETAALLLGAEVEAIKAVADVETSGNAFDDSGRPRILFERHYFHRLTAGRYDKAHGHISAKAYGGYGTFSAQYGKLEEAYALDPDAALRSASWGRFQIMGDNHRAAGYVTVALFVKALAESEANHLMSFVKFVSNSHAMADALRKKQWARFAKAYNGPGFKRNRYDDRLQAAYDLLLQKAQP